jgi:hypothetical protein
MSLVTLGVIGGCQNERHVVVESPDRTVYVPAPSTPPNPPADPLATGNTPPAVEVDRVKPAPADEPGIIPNPGPAPTESTPAVVTPAPSTPGAAAAPAPVGAAPAAAQATGQVAADIAYQPPPAEVYTAYEQELSPYGRWVDVEHWGRCWVPNDRRADWRPYTVGHWQYSDSGWLWVSDGAEARWGIITYHYGRWFPDRRHGWCWLPGSVWAPAWVAWREGHGYCAWAPLAPILSDGVILNASIVDRYCPADWFIGCETRYLTSPQLSQYIVVNNPTIINQTTDITNVTYQNDRAVIRGVEVAAVEKASGRKIERVQLTEAKTAEEARKSLEQNRPVIFAPPALAKIGEQRITQHAQQNPANAAASSTAEPRNATNAERGQTAQPANARVPASERPQPGEAAPKEPGTFAPPAVNAPPPRKPTPPPTPTGREAGPSAPAPTPGQTPPTPPTRQTPGAPPAGNTATTPPTPSAGPSNAPANTGGNAPANNTGNAPGNGPSNAPAGKGNPPAQQGGNAPAPAAGGGGGKP